MPKKKDVSVDLIPQLQDYIIKADPGDPSAGRDKFVCPKLSILKDNNGEFKVRIPGGTDTWLTTQLEGTILAKSPETYCKCTPKADTKTVVCYSKDRVRSSKGFACRTECPYAETGKDPELKKYKRPLKKVMFFLVRKKGSDDPFILARYEGAMDRVNLIDSLKSNISQTLSAAGIEPCYPSSNILTFSAGVETTQSGWKVGKITSFEHLETLSEEDAAKIAKLNKDLTDFLNYSLQDYAEYTQKMAKDREAMMAKEEAIEDRKAQVEAAAEAKEEAETEEVAEKVEEKVEEAPKEKEAPKKKASAKKTTPSKEEESISEEVDDYADSDDEEDDLPF